MKGTGRYSRLAALLAALFLIAAPGGFAQRAEDRLADDQYNFATQLFGKKLYELAIQQYEKFVADYPRHQKVNQARVRVGESYLRLNRFPQAADAFSRVLAENPENNFRLEVLVGLGVARFHMGKDDPTKYGEAVTALSEAQKLAVAADNKELGPGACNWLGESYYKLEKWPEAVAAYQAAARWPESPVAAQAIYSAGYCQWKAGQDEAAVVSWLRVADDYPNSEVAAEASYRAADALLRMKKYPLAERRFKDVVAKYKTTEFAAKAQLGLGYVAFQQGQYAQARTQFETVETVDPKSEAARTARLRSADCSYYLQDYKGAAARYEAVAKGGDPKSAREAAYWLSVCRGQLGDTKGAIAALEPLAADGSDPASALRARLRIADMRMAAGELEPAAAAYAAAIAVVPSGDTATLDRATYGRGVCLFRLGKVADAEAQFAAVLQRRGNSPTTQLAALGLAQCHVDSKRPADAVVVLTELVKGELPAETRAPALALLGFAHRDLQQNEPAIVAFRELVDKYPTSAQAPACAATLALLYQKEKRDKEASEIASLLMEKYGSDPAAAQALVTLGDGYRAAGNLVAASSLYEKVITGSPTPEVKTAAYTGLALTFATGPVPDVDGANRALKSLEASEKDPTRIAEVRYFLAAAYEKANQPDAALEQYQAVLASGGDPEKAASAGYRCGAILAGQKKPGEAIEALKAVVERFPKAKVRPDALYELAWAYSDNKQKAEAQATFGRLEQEFPAHALGVDATFRLAEEDFAGKRYPEAAERYEKVLASPEGASLADKGWYKLGWCRREMKDTKAAALAFGAVVSRFGKSELVPESRLRLAEALISQGQPEQAEPVLRQLVSPQKPARPDDQWLDAQARVALATIYLGKGESAAARELVIDRVATTSFGAVGLRAQLLLGESYLAEKKHKEAAVEFLKVVNIYPRVDEAFAQAYFELGECYAKVGQKKDAREAWQFAAEKFGDNDWAKQARERLEK